MGKIMGTKGACFADENDGFVWRWYGRASSTQHGKKAAPSEAEHPKAVSVGLLGNMLGWFSGGGSWHNETVTVEMGADDWIDEVYYNGKDIRGTVSRVGTGANEIKMFTFDAVRGGVLCVAANDNQPGHAASFFLRATSNQPGSGWNFALQPGDERCKAFGTGGISGGGPHHDEHVGSMGRPRQWDPPEGWTADAFDDSGWKAPTSETNHGQHGPQHHWSAYHTRQLGVPLPGVWHDTHKYTFYRIRVGPPAEEEAVSTPIVVMGTAVVGGSGEGGSSGAGSMPLIDQVNLLKRELNLEGNIAKVVADACVQLGVSTKGKSLVEQATECCRVLGL